MHANRRIPESTEKALKNLWGKIFHDSVEYIDLFFNNYFAKSYVGVCYDEDKLVGGLVGVPYMVSCKNNISSDEMFYGVYLCGLMTDEEYRGRGIMNKLLSITCNKVCEDGYLFVFLIPSNEKNRLYYKKRKFVDFFTYNEYKTARYSDMNNINIDNIIFTDNITDFKLLDNLCEYLLSKEMLIYGINICHCKSDYLTLIREHFLSHGVLAILYDDVKNISGVAFILQEDNVTIVKYITTDSSDQLEQMVKKIKENYSEYRVQYRIYPGQEEILQSKIFLYPDVINYGMTRNLILNENRKIEESRLTGLNFSIFAPCEKLADFSKISCAQLDDIQINSKVEKVRSGSMFLMLD